MRTARRVFRTDAQPLLAIQEEDAPEVLEAEVLETEGEMWQEHTRSMWSQMTKQELEEEVQWRADDQQDLSNSVKYLRAEFAKKDEDIKQKDKEIKYKDEEIIRSGKDILRQFKVIDRQRLYIDSLHQLMQRCRGPMQQLMDTSTDERPQRDSSVPDA